MSDCNCSIKIAYENEKSHYGDTFEAHFESNRGAQMFIMALEKKNIDYTVEGI